jgi:hypothetical protein
MNANILARQYGLERVFRSWLVAAEGKFYNDIRGRDFPLVLLDRDGLLPVLTKSALDRLVNQDQIRCRSTLGSPGQHRGIIPNRSLEPWSLAARASLALDCAE